MRHFKVIAFVTVSLMLAIPLRGQLPQYLTEEEKALLPAYLESLPKSSSGIITPPASPVRTMAEWEEIDALIVVYTSYTSIVRQIIRYAREECEVFVVCTDSNQVKTALTNDGIPLSNIRYFHLPFNSVWVRDYGPWTVYKDDVDSIYQVDWIYNRPRPLDDTIPNAIAAYLGVPHYQTTTAPYDLINTGGNLMTDGLGTGFSSKLVLDENDGNGVHPITYPTHTEEEIDDIMLQFMGIDRYIKMETLPYDGIHHIDMHMKLLDEESLLVGEYPTGISDGPQIEANLQYVLQNFNSVFGTPYKVIRILQPPAGGQYPPAASYRTYANAVFVNKTVLLPTYEEQYDTTALRIWREALPGYRIIGINCNQMIGAGGAVHCITKAVGSRDPLLIVHQPLEDQFGQTFTVNASIKHRSGISEAFVWYRIDTTVPFAAVPMSPAGNDMWTADITIALADATVQYYVMAEATSGKSQVRPLVAPDGFWTFTIGSPVAVFEQDNSRLMIGRPYPQPGRDIVTIPLDATSDILLHAWLLDENGRLIRDMLNGTLAAGSHQVVVNGAVLNAGVYSVVMEAAGHRQTTRIIIQ